jgi:excinuclease ABC subunit A
MDIYVRNAAENNLQQVSLRIPKNKLVAVTGVSGSGKSSLVFDVLYREAESRYLGSFSSSARQFLGRMKHPDVEEIEGLSPAIAVRQNAHSASPRSTVGTITGIHDHLRLWFARLGKSPIPGLKIHRSLFSFNSPTGACPVCKGLGVEDRLDPDLLIADENRSLRQGCLKITAPNGYIIYSQVTMDVLDEVCRAEGFSVDIPWKDLTPSQKNVVLYGSNRIQIPFGKHTLESRMRWTGITAKPRETGYYKGILPIMDAILKSKRNKNILRFVRTSNCSACGGARLNPSALSVRISGLNIADLAALPLNRLRDTIHRMHLKESDKRIADPILQTLSRQIDLISRLGLSYLTSDRESTTLSAGEGQRLRLATQAGAALSGVLYLFDEPSIGLHPRDTRRLIEVMMELRDRGNSVIVVEHDEEFISHADWVIEIGPGAGVDGGRVLLNLPASQMLEMPEPEARQSPTLSFYRGYETLPTPVTRRTGAGEMRIHGASEHNLQSIDVGFKLQALNVVTGVSGAGKSTLVHRVLGDFLRMRLHGSPAKPGKCASISGWEGIGKLITIDQAPIGRTPRSNPATYTGLFDEIRTRFASLPESKERGWEKGRFSFNTPGGRCETCEGAGYQQVGMHFMGVVEVLCEECNGSRFHEDTLQIRYRGKNIDNVLDLSVNDARDFFRNEPAIGRYLQTMADLGLGYVKLGQRSSTLSGGEAQRIKLATELARPQSSHTLYLLDEPTTGLHQADVRNLMQALNALVEQQHTVIVIEHHLGLIAAADWIVDLGPESGDRGGALVIEGLPEQVATCATSFTGQELSRYFIRNHAGRDRVHCMPTQREPTSIQFTGVETNNLRRVDVSIPHNRLTAITGVSGSGKSSLAFDTIYAEGRNRFLESYSTYVRSQIGISSQSVFETASGLTPALAIDQKSPGGNLRSTLGTMTGIYDLVRILYSREATDVNGKRAGHSSVFSFNHQSGACPNCKGLGEITVCDPDRMVTQSDRSILAGAMDGTKTGKFYGDPAGQYIAALKAVGSRHRVDFSLPWKRLSEPEKALALYGTGDEVYEVAWNYQRGERTGTHHFRGKWAGIVGLVNAEYERKHADHRGQSMLPLMKQEPCPQCRGARLKSNALEYLLKGANIAQVAALPVCDALRFFKENFTDSNAVAVIADIVRRLEYLDSMGLDYLTIGRRSDHLSGGETQRIKLAAQLGGNLTNITYVLDEPTLGLHPSDIQRLIQMLELLRRSSNTVIVVEHDPDVIRAADHVIDLGPGAGILGGNIVAAGTPDAIMRDPHSITGSYLKRNPVITSKRRRIEEGIRIRGAHAHNLQHIDVEIPSAGIITVTGVSGSGKSSLVFDVIHESHKRGKPWNCTSIDGLHRFNRLISVDRKSHFAAPSSTPATFTGILDRIRELFAATVQARAAGFKKKHFSFNEKEGRCPACQGCGQITVSMDFLSDVNLPCEQCRGTRYTDPVLECRLEGKSIADILAMAASEAAAFFAGDRKLHSQLDMLNQVGLGYIQLGQPIPALSGGEVQRLELAAELMKPTKGPTLYLFDEPTTGLHFRDIEYLLGLFHRLADRGHTLIVIEHDAEMILASDWMIDLGPGGGNRGGNLVASGRIDDFLGNPDSLTASCLQLKLKG